MAETTDTTQPETTDNPQTDTTQPETTDNEAVEVCEGLLQSILAELIKLNKVFGAK
ncbi:hypothetical protein [Arcobacter aquimarinus]|uniref:hypothetical protein n=1 Tax=Arcobacter aquimarinus TaxID=1315211 RepID=UPI003BB18C8B